MNKLPLSPTDVTEFTCEDAVYWDMLDNMAGNSTQGRNAIRAEWSHRIADGVARADVLSEQGKTYEAIELLRQCGKASRAYVAWLDSLKGGQNA